MYGSRREFEGRITGFTMGTGSTLALLPAQNATGNFVKIVQRLPVRIELTDYDPDKAPCSSACRSSPMCTSRSRPRGRTPGTCCNRFYTLPEDAASGQRRDACANEGSRFRRPERALNGDAGEA